ncbi:MAG TPA: rhodanese-like domain-containing protein, partial [Thermoanaerobaculia bacterium]|nr:rhodanese-like domain-containing protein [Thermoanaerobaculia bacterium]
MRRAITQWSLPSKLALAAFVLGALAIFGDPYGGGAVTLHPHELAALVQKEIDHVSAQELAGWIIQGHSDYRLIDLRDAPSYATYHIPPAENLAITDLPGDTLARNEKIILYSDGGIHAAQAWMLLEAQGYKNVYILRGGLEEWNDRILYPTLPANATPEQIAAFAKDRQVSAFFGGTPRIGGAPEATAAPVPATPTVAAPA